MKMKADFVTNSSSTSFVIISNGEFTKESFFALVGVSEESPLSPIFATLFECLIDNMVPASDYRARNYYSYDDLVAFVGKEFSEEIAHRVAEAQKRGSRVYIGELSSDNGEIQSFFCCDSFELENESIYLNALECIW